MSILAASPAIAAFVTLALGGRPNRWHEFHEALSPAPPTVPHPPIAVASGMPKDLGVTDGTFVRSSFAPASLHSGMKIPMLATLTPCIGRWAAICLPALTRVTTAPARMLRHFERRAEPVVATIAQFLIPASVMLMPSLRRAARLMIFPSPDANERPKGVSA